MLCCAIDCRWWRAIVCQGRSRAKRSSLVVRTPFSCSTAVFLLKTLRTQRKKKGSEAKNPDKIIMSGSPSIGERTRRALRSCSTCTRRYLPNQRSRAGGDTHASKLERPAKEVPLCGDAASASVQNFSGTPTRNGKATPPSTVLG